MVKRCQMKVIIATWGSEFFLDIGPREPVLEIKQKIEQVLGVPIYSQTLAVLGWELIDGLDMEDYPIVAEGTRIDLTFQQGGFMISPPDWDVAYCGKINITVKVSSRWISMEVDRTETVRSLKEKIHILGGLPIKRMSLYFAGRELENDFCSICEYGICESSEVVVLLSTLNRQKDEPSTRRLNLVVQTSSSLLNGTRIPLNLSDTCSVNDVKDLLISSETIPSDDYILIHKQRIMRDTCSMRWHGVEDGESLYIFRGTVTRSSSA